MADLAQALMNLRPGAQWMLKGHSIDGLCWLDSGQSQPTLQEIETELARMDQEHRATQYQRDRAASYPAIEEQLDMLYHHGLDGWKATITAIKHQYPKSVPDSDK
jgi:hypothetical protein